MSGHEGSSIALWSANGTLLRKAQLLSASNAAQPPSLDCMPTSQAIARRSQRSWAAASEAVACWSASSTIAVSSMSG